MKKPLPQHPEFNRIVRDTFSIILAEVRELEKFMDEEKSEADMMKLVERSGEQVKKLIELHVKSWSPELREELLVTMVGNDIQKGVAGAMSMITAAYVLHGVPFSTTAERLFKAANKSS